MQKTFSTYYNLGYWGLLLIALAFIGFYASYLSVIFQPKASIIHIHFVLLTLWMIMLVTQPFLIKYKKQSLHRTLGKISYFLVPLVWISSFLMIRFTYYRDIDQLSQDAAQGLNNFNHNQILQQAAEFKALPFIWLLWFFVFYTLAIINRRKTGIHARYMVATALSLLGPIIDRIVFNLEFLEKLGTYIPLLSIAFLLADFVIASLLVKDYKNKLPTKTLWTSLFILIIGQVLYFTLSDTDGWQYLMTFMMNSN